MAKFEFRLDRVLEYRQLEEDWARATYLEARAARVAHEQEIDLLRQKRIDVLAEPIFTLESHRALEIYLGQMDEQERLDHVAMSVLMDEEAIALTHWQSKKQDVQVLDKLREQALEEWKLDEARLEQAQLDEWTTSRRAA